MHTVTLRQQDGIAILTLNRPDKLNALSHAMRSRLMALLDELRESFMARTIIITGAGEKAFSAGADLAEMQDAVLGNHAIETVVLHGQAMTAMIETYPKPVIAAVNGLAFGGGCEIVEACHLVVAAETATFAKPEISLGMPPSFGGTQRLPRLVGRRVALEHLLTGEAFGVIRARAEGLVNAVVPPQQLLGRATELAAKIARHPPEALKAVLEAVSHGLHLPMAEALSVEQKAFATICGSKNHRDALDSWLRRKRGLSHNLAPQAAGE